VAEDLDMTTALWALATAVFCLAGVVMWAAWTYFFATGGNLDGLTDEEIAARLAPHVARELIIRDFTLDLDDQP
jgi:hypothetical protein